MKESSFAIAYTPGVQRCVDRIRAALAEESVEQALLRRLQSILVHFLHEGVIGSEIPVPEPLTARDLHHDEQLGFRLRVRTHMPGETETPHDHADTWSVYALHRGAQRVVHYERLDDGSVPGRCRVVVAKTVELRPGEADSVAARAIHQDITASDGAVRVGIQGRDTSGHWVNHFDIERGLVLRDPVPRGGFVTERRKAWVEGRGCVDPVELVRAASSGSP